MTKEKRALHHVRPAPVRLPGLRRAPVFRDAEHRRPGGARGAVHARLCPVAGVRPVADELLHRPVHAIARGRTGTAFPFASASRPRGIICASFGIRMALVGKTHMTSDRRGQLAIGHDPRIYNRRARVRMRLRALRPRRRPASGQPPSLQRALQRLSPVERLRRRRTPGRQGPIPVRRPTEAGTRGRLAPRPRRQRRRACRRGPSRDALDDQSRHAVHA